ncbi:MAG: NAD(P)H-dependent oxidoreductase subunit E [Candidatus Cloacimonetes bacterium]|nr:NAD(P)H-dependent oxidoreductase subunit E [Candidatus Cloacimonadota bacterium]
MLDFISSTIAKYGKDQTRLMDILIQIQSSVGYIPEEGIALLGRELDLPEADIVQTVSFYHFFSTEPSGKVRIFLDDSVVANMKGRKEVKAAFEQEAGIKFGEVTPDNQIGLFDTACIGMSDQEPAALINNVVYTNLTAAQATEIIKGIRNGKDVCALLGNDCCSRAEGCAPIKSKVENNIRVKGPILGDHEPGAALRKAVSMTSQEVIDEIKDSGLRGRGGAGFPTGLKWEFCSKTEEQTRYIFCNADEGEPGTFKDRVILTTQPELLFEGMALAGYAVGSKQGILYLRYEYKYLETHLEGVLSALREQHLLGDSIAGKKGFDFDVRIQFGGGAYVCGEETALIESAEGKRGEPRDRPPFPVTSGYLQKPTVVNNVETLCSCAKILLDGADWFKDLGTGKSTGTKLLSISGDCAKPGIYELEWGFTVAEVLEMAGAADVQAVQVGGPSGRCVGPDEFFRQLCFADLATGGSLIVIGKNRCLLSDVVLNFTEFFIEESCGSCVPCRALTVQYKETLKKILRGKGTENDIVAMRSWRNIMLMNRCGLGHTAANPILTTIQNFPQLYEQLLVDADFVSDFDMAEAVAESCKAAGRIPNLDGGHHE